MYLYICTSVYLYICVSVSLCTFEYDTPGQTSVGAPTASCARLWAASSPTVYQESKELF